jgi:hypothetical protein
VTSIAWTAAQRVVTAWHTTGRTVLSGLREALAAMIPADFNDGHAFHAREELQRAWRELSTMDAFVSLALDMERTHRVNQPGDPVVSTVVQLVEDPLPTAAMPTTLACPVSAGPRSPTMAVTACVPWAAVGPASRCAPYREARAWVDRNFYDLPNMDTRANLIRELDNRWPDAA